MESISTIERGRGRGPRQYAYAAVAAVALIGVVGLTTGPLGSYVAYDGEAVGAEPQPDTRVMVALPQRETEAEAATNALPASAPEARRTSRATPGSTARANQAAAVADDRGPSPDPSPGESEPGEGDGDGQPPNSTGEPPSISGDPPPGAAPIPEPTETEPPVDVRPVPEPVAAEPAPDQEASSAPAEPLTATTTGLDDALGSLGVDLPITDLAGPVTAPADHILGLLRGSGG